MNFTKILDNPTGLPAFLACSKKFLVILKFCDLKIRYFWEDFGAENEVRLSPFEDDKPKDAENTDFEAGSDNTPMANDCYRNLHLTTAYGRASPQGEAFERFAMLGIKCRGGSRTARNTGHSWMSPTKFFHLILLPYKVPCIQNFMSLISPDVYGYAEF